MLRTGLVVILLAGTAHAQVFRARSKTGAMHPVATPIVTVAAKPGVGKAPAVAAVAAPAKAKAATAPHVAAKKATKHVAKKKSGDDDDVVVVDDDDDN